MPAEQDAAGTQSGDQQAVQIRAVNVDEGSSEGTLRAVVEYQFVQGFAGSDVATEEGVGLDPRADHRLLQAQSAHDLRGAGAEDDAGADAREGLRLLEHGHAMALPLQESRDRQPGDPDPDGDNPPGLLHPSLRSFESE